MIQGKIEGKLLSYEWRDENSGVCQFLFQTREKSLLPASDRENEDGSIIVYCDAEKGMQLVYEGMPIQLSGFLKQKEDRMVFRVKEAVPYPYEKNVTTDFLCGQFPALDKETADALYDEAGAELFDKIAGQEGEHFLGKYLDTRQSSYVCSIVRRDREERKLFSMVWPCGTSLTDCRRLITIYGSSAYEKLKKSPYKVGARAGIPFIVCDKLALSFGFSKNSEERAEAVISAAMALISDEGNTRCRMPILRKKLDGIVRMQREARLPVCTYTAALSRISNIRTTGSGITYIEIPELVELERQIYNDIRRIQAAGKELAEPFDPFLMEQVTKENGIRLGSQQKEAFLMGMTHAGLFIVTGGPGTGKTTTMNSILLGKEKRHPHCKIVLCAPSGRAAQRMSESTGRPAFTAHRVVGYRGDGDMSGVRDQDNPIDADILWIDEVSMMDVRLFALLLRAVKPGTTVILSGDVDQLESVDAGLVLHDLLNASAEEIPRVQLTEVFRQKGNSRIVMNSRRIRGGSSIMELGDDFKRIRTTTSEETKNKTIRICMDNYKKEDPYNTQILTPSKEGEAGIKNLNRELQYLLNQNPVGLVFNSTRYKQGDKVMFGRNNYKTGYYNGDIGLINEIRNHALFIEIVGRGELQEDGSRKKIILKIEREDLKDVSLSYAMSIHKSQGSEFPNVVISLPGEFKNLLTRTLLYTGITRAKERAILVDECNAGLFACGNKLATQRETVLGEIIKNLPKALPNAV